MEDFSEIVQIQSLDVSSLIDSPDPVKPKIFRPSRSKTHVGRNLFKCPNDLAWTYNFLDQNWYMESVSEEPYPGEIDLGAIWGAEGLRLYLDGEAGRREKLEEEGYDDEWLDLFELVSEKLKGQERLVPSKDSREKLINGYRELAKFSESLRTGIVRESEIERSIERAEELRNFYHEESPYY